MACLGSVLYDPAAAATAATTAAGAAMTAFDTTNARITFTAPANGIVLVKLRVALKGATTPPQILLGVLDGATVRGRQAVFWATRVQATNLRSGEVVFPVTGLTPSSSYTFDAAYGIETGFASTQLGWGGANNTTANDAYGALSFEIWETTGILGAINYDPAAAVSKSTATASVMAALDTTNLRIAFTVPSTGRVFVRLRSTAHGGTNIPTYFLGVLEGSTVKMRMAAQQSSQLPTALATDLIVGEAAAVIGGLTPAASLTWDAAWATETIVASSAIKYGGPNNTTANDAFGGFVFEVWPA